jgi:hypothetical protein
MRTTIDLDDELHRFARERAFRERRSLGAVVSELALAGLRLDPGSGRRRPLGKFAGQVVIADDFDETPDEIVRSVETPIT